MTRRPDIEHVTAVVVGAVALVVGCAVTVFVMIGGALRGFDVFEWLDESRGDD